MSQIVKLTANMSVAIRDADSNEQKSIPITVKALKLGTESQEYRAIGTFVACGYLAFYSTSLGEDSSSHKTQSGGPINQVAKHISVEKVDTLPKQDQPDPPS